MNATLPPAISTTQEYINIGQLSEYLGWSPRFIEGLVRGEHLPGFEVEGQWRFRRNDVVDWLEQKIQTLDGNRVGELEARLESSLLADGTFRTNRADRLTSRFPADSILLDVPATNKLEVLRAITRLAAGTGLLSDEEQLLSSLVDRESLCSTAMPGGVALCHPRRPVPSLIERQFLCFIRTTRPIDYGAEDGEGTSLFFLLCAPDDRSHLHGIARLARALQGRTLGFLRDAGSPGEVLSILADAESQFVAAKR